MRDAVADATSLTAETVVAVWHWDPGHNAIAWSSNGLLQTLGLRDHAMLLNDPAHEVLRVASAQAARAESSAITIQRPARLLFGEAVARPLVLADGTRGWRVEWTIERPTRSAVDPRLAVAMVEAMPLPVAVLDADGGIVAANGAFNREIGRGADPLDTAAHARHGWSLDVTPMHNGLRLLTLQQHRRADIGIADPSSPQSAHAALRSPLTAVMGFAEFLRQTVEDLSPTKRQAYLADLNREVHRLEQAVDALIEPPPDDH